MYRPGTWFTPERGSVYPGALPAIEYGDGDHVRKVGVEGRTSFKGQVFKVGRALRGYPVALRPTATDGIWGVWFMTHPIGAVDLRGPEPQMNRSPMCKGYPRTPVNHVSGLYNTSVGGRIQAMAG